MNLLGSLLSKILGRNPLAVTPTPAPIPVPEVPAAPEVPATVEAPPAVVPVPIEPVDVEKLLAELAAQHPEKLDWKKSIVDLMKLVGMDSSLSERKELAKELGYTGDPSDSAKMNLWLHKEVLRQLAQNGGKVPADLLD
jgi:hypothetical protein